MRRKTIKSLTSKNKAVYVRLSTEKVAEVFFALAEYEGFTLRGIEKTKVREGCYLRLNDDVTVSYPEYHSWAGAVMFHHAKTENGKKVIKIDFEKWLKL